MAYDFATRHDRLRTRMREVNSRTVTYRRDKRTASVSATVYELSPDVLIPLGVPLDTRRRDYIIHLEALADAGNPFDVPMVGDEITDNDLTCQVVPLASGDPCFQYTNHQRNAVRIHTQVIKELVS